MMVRKIKYGKIAVVIFLTILIWVWADLALDEESPDKPATIFVDESANPKLWVSFNQASSADIKITLSGPHTAVVDVSRKLKGGKGIEFNFDAAQENMDNPGDYSLPLLAFLQKDKEIRRRGLTVVSCEPEILDVNVVELVEKSLPVECFNEDGMPLQDVESIEPKKVDMFVPEDHRTARVQLTRREIDQARLLAVEKTPYIVLAAGQIREGTTAVKVKMLPEEDRLSDYTITNTTLSVALSPTLLGEYSVNVTNLPEVLGPIAIRATPEAKRTYESQPLPLMTLYIFDDDAEAEKVALEQRKAVVYNFPPEFVRKDEIKLKNPQQSAEAKFKLIPLSSAETTSSGVD